MTGILKFVLAVFLPIPTNLAVGTAARKSESVIG